MACGSSGSTRGTSPSSSTTSAPYADPLDQPRAEALADILANRRQELDRYKHKCEQLAEEVQELASLSDLTERVQKFIRLHVADEIGELLHLNKRMREAYVTSVLGDEKTWAATLGTIAALAAGQPEVSLGAGIAGIASFGAKALRAAHDRRQKLQTSDFRLVYRMSRVD